MISLGMERGGPLKKEIFAAQNKANKPPTALDIIVGMKGNSTDVTLSQNILSPD